MSTATNNGAHILVFPFPAQGHMLPLLDLTHQLSLRNLTITILITPKNLPILNPILSANPSIQTLILPFPKHPSIQIPPGVENVKDLGNQGNIAIITALSHLQGQIIEWFQSHSNPPVALLSDFFLGWTHHLGQRLGIPRIAFYSSGAFSTAALDILWENPDDIVPGSVVEFQDLPRRPSFIWDHTPSVFRRYREVEPRVETVRISMMANSLSWASVFNTFEALEDDFLEFWRKKVGHSRLYSVGPLNLMSWRDAVRSSDQKLGPGGDDVLSWLDQCDSGSVLYVCFGSQKLLTKAQTKALAIGLEKSGVRFVWVVKTLTAQQVADGYGTVPDGFEERVVNRGFVITDWAPQVQILSHRAVAGFLSHCGWNSVLEGISAGVLILGWPMEADQFFDAKLLVEYKEAAFRVCEGSETEPDSVELARILKDAMNVNVVERIRAKKLKDEALKAIKSGGSSSTDMDRLVQELGVLQMNNI